MPYTLVSKDGKYRIEGIPDDISPDDSKIGERFAKMRGSESKAPESKVNVENTPKAQEKTESPKKSSPTVKKEESKKRLSSEEIDALLGRTKPNSAAGMIGGAAKIGSNLMGIVDGNADARNADIDDYFKSLGYDPESTGYGAGNFLTEMMAGGAALKGAGMIPKVGKAIESAGFGAKTLAGRVGGGAAAGALTSGVVDTDEVGTGATIGAILPAFLDKGARLIGNSAPAAYFRDLVSGSLPQARAQKAVQAAAGDQLVPLQEMMRKAPDNITAAQAAEPLNAYNFQALADDAMERDATRYFPDLAAKQQAERMGSLEKMSGGSTKTAERDARSAMKKQLNKDTRPLREDALNAIPKGSIQAKDLTNKIDEMLVTDDIKLEPQSEEALMKVRGLIKKIAKEDGSVDPKSLYELRKKGVNNVIEELLKTADPSTKKKQTSAILKKVKPIIDDALEQAGGEGWENYLSTYAAGAKKIDEAKLIGEGRDRLSKGTKRFVDLIGGNDPRAVEKVMGSGKYDITKQLPNQMDELSRIRGEVVRDLSVKDQAKKGKPALKDILQRAGLEDTYELPNPLDAKVSLVNRAIRKLEGNANERAQILLGEAMRSGRDLNELLQYVPESKRYAVINAINKALQNPQGWGSKLTGASSAAISD